jgi:hypothetical protein
MKKFLLASVLIFTTGLTGCAEPEQGPKTKAVYMLLDTSGTYTQELDKAQNIINYLLLSLNSGDSIAVARIDSGSFSEKDIVAKVTFDSRPSAVNEQKRAFKRKIDSFVEDAKGSSHTDISGGVLQAAEYLAETGANERYVLIFSDLEEDLAKGQVRDFVIPLVDVNVVAVNVTKLRSDNMDPREYLNRLDQWQQRVIQGGGNWKVLNNLERLDHLLVI